MLTKSAFEAKARLPRNRSLIVLELVLVLEFSSAGGFYRLHFAQISNSFWSAMRGVKKFACRDIKGRSPWLAKACCEVSRIGPGLSRRDGAIVAWHEVPGTAPPQRAIP